MEKVNAVYIDAVSISLPFNFIIVFFYIFTLLLDKFRVVGVNSYIDFICNDIKNL
jgi:hypothetical protein